MRIDDKFKFDLNRTNDTSAKKKKESAGKSAESGSGSDSIQISDSAKDVANLKNSVKGAPEIRVELVQELKVKIASGQYDVSGKKVAESIVNKAIDDLF
jgi:negative regulator of flagellin synthesis FlgM